jgi:hypothetical protein
MKRKLKNIVLVMASSREMYKELEDSVRETWFNDSTDDTAIIFYKDHGGNPSIAEPTFDGSDLVIPCETGDPTKNIHLGKITSLAFEWVLENFDFDYLYRSNLGAYVNIERLENFLVDKPRESFYCGIVGLDSYWLGIDVEFASGSGYFLSRDMVDLVVSNKDNIVNVVDDVALGFMMSSLGVKVNRSAKRKNLCDGNVFYQIGDQEVEIIPEEEIYHYRLRSNDRGIDIKNMKEIHYGKI